jgi:hypothetical protein
VAILRGRFDETKLESETLLRLVGGTLSVAGTIAAKRDRGEGNGSSESNALSSRHRHQLPPLHP